MVSQYPPLPFFDFSCNIPSPLTFWEAGGGGTGRFVTSSRSVMEGDLGAGKNSSTS